jgi:hypothetical protein
MFLSTLWENLITINTVKSLHINPVRGKVNLPRKGIEAPDIIRNPIPREAPEDTPNVYGDAKGSLSID